MLPKSHIVVAATGFIKYLKHINIGHLLLSNRIWRDVLIPGAHHDFVNDVIKPSLWHFVLFYQRLLKSATFHRYIINKTSLSLVPP